MSIIVPDCCKGSARSLQAADFRTDRGASPRHRPTTRFSYARRVAHAAVFVRCSSGPVRDRRVGAVKRSATPRSQRRRSMRSHQPRDSLVRHATGSMGPSTPGPGRWLERLAPSGLVQVHTTLDHELHQRPVRVAHHPTERASVAVVCRSGGAHRNEQQSELAGSRGALGPEQPGTDCRRSNPVTARDALADSAPPGVLHRGPGTLPPTAVVESDRSAPYRARCCSSNPRHEGPPLHRAGDTPSPAVRKRQLPSTRLSPARNSSAAAARSSHQGGHRARCRGFRRSRSVR